jgi:transposase
MIVPGADIHKRSHKIAAVAAGTGEVLGEKTVPVGVRGFASLLVWARGLEGERVWALEDCRHVAGSFERFLIARGERVLRVPTKLMAGARRAARERGKSDSIDSIAAARAALREGLGDLPAPLRREQRAARKRELGPQIVQVPLKRVVEPTRWPTRRSR